MPLAMAIDVQSTGNVEVRVTVAPLALGTDPDLRVYWKSGEYTKTGGGATPVPDLAGHEGTSFHDVEPAKSYTVALVHQSPGSPYEVCARLEPTQPDGKVCEQSKGQ